MTRFCHPRKRRDPAPEIRLSDAALGKVDHVFAALEHGRPKEKP